jgi:hypothetical protein
VTVLEPLDAKGPGIPFGNTPPDFHFVDRNRPGPVETDKVLTRAIGGDPGIVAVAKPVEIPEFLSGFFAFFDPFPVDQDLGPVTGEGGVNGDFRPGGIF